MELMGVPRGASSVITHWTFKRKMRVVLQVKHGQFTREEACTEYGLSPDELNEWITKHDKFGPLSLKSSNVQQYRSRYENDDGRGSRANHLPGTASN